MTTRASRVSDFFQVIDAFIKDPVYKDHLTTAVTLFPCGHNVNEDVAELCKKRKICPIGNHPVEEYAVNEGLRNTVNAIEKFRLEYQLLTNDLENTEVFELSKKRKTHHSDSYLVIDDDLSNDEIQEMITPMQPLSPQDLSPENFPLIPTHPTPIPKAELDITKDLSLEELETIPIKKFINSISITQGSSYGKLCRNLARMLPLKMSAYIENQLISREDLCKKALECNPDDSRAYCYLAEIMDEEKISETEIHHTLFSSFDLYVKALEINPDEASAYIGLGMALSTNDTVSIQGKPWSKQALYKKAFQKNPNDFRVYLGLGQVFNPNETISGLPLDLHSPQDLFCKAIELRPEDGRAYLELATIAKNNSSIFVPQMGKEVSPKELCIQGLKLGAPLKEGLLLLSSLLKENESVTIQGKNWDHKQIYCKIIELDKNFAQPYFKLGTYLQKTEVVTLFNRNFSAKECYSKAIKLGLKESIAYIQLADLLDEKVDKEAADKKDLYHKAILLHFQTPQLSLPALAKTVIKLANLLKENDSVEYQENIYNKQQLYLQAIQINPAEASAYIQIAKTFPEKEFLLINKIPYSKSDLCKKAIQLDPQDANAYADLASYLMKEQKNTAVLLDDKKWTVQELITKALTIDPLNASNWFLLVRHLEKHHSYKGNHAPISIFPHESLSKIQIYQKIIQLNPSKSLYYTELAKCLNNHESVTLFHQQDTKKTLFIQAIQLNPLKKDNYFDLAVLLNDTEAVEIVFNNQKEMFTKALLVQKAQSLQTLEENLDGEPSNPYLALAHYLEKNDIKENDTVELRTGEKITKQNLYLECIHQKPSQGKFYIQLGALMKNIDLVTLRDGSKMHKEDLYSKGLNLCEQNPETYHWIAQTLSSNKEELHLTSKNQHNHLFQFQIISRKELYLKAIEFSPLHADSYCHLADTIGREVKRPALRTPEKSTLRTPEKSNIHTLEYTIRLPDGVKYDLKTLYIKSIELNPEITNPYLSLAMLLDKGNSAKIHGIEFSKQALCLKAFEHMHTLNIYNKEWMVNIYYHLAHTLKKDQTIDIGQKTYSALQLYTKVLSLDETYWKAAERLEKLKLPESLMLDNNTPVDNKYLRRIIEKYKDK